MSPRLLDLFCGAGGAAMGYHRAGFEVVGVDIAPQPDYPFKFYQRNALDVLWEGWANFDVIHASPPCHDHSALRSRSGLDGTGGLLSETIRLLEQAGLPYVVENVPGSELDMGGAWTLLCGSSFGLKVRRHRLFRTNFPILSLPCEHAIQGQPIGCYGAGTHSKNARGRKGNAAERAEAMGIDWMTVAEMSQAIPPAYAEFIGAQLLAHLAAVPQ